MIYLSKLLGHVPTVYSEGGGKSGGGQTEVAPPISTTTAVGSALDAPQETFEEEDKLDKVETKKLGTRGLRIPLGNTTPTTQANTGVQL